MTKKMSMPDKEKRFLLNGEEDDLYYALKDLNLLIQ